MTLMRSLCCWVMILTNCFLASNLLVINLRVRTVTLCETIVFQFVYASLWQLMSVCVVGKEFFQKFSHKRELVNHNLNEHEKVQRSFNHEDKCRFTIQTVILIGFQKWTVYIIWICSVLRKEGKRDKSYSLRHANKMNSTKEKALHWIQILNVEKTCLFYWHILFSIVSIPAECLRNAYIYIYSKENSVVLI